MDSVFHSVAAIKTDGTLWTWGFNCNGVLGDGTTVERCSPGTVAGGGTTWCKVALGFSEAIAIKTDGTIWTWGDNNQGQLGDGTILKRCSPGTIFGGSTDWSNIGINLSTTFGIKTNGTLWSWGSGGYLGNGVPGFIDRCSPGTVAGNSINWVCVCGKGSTVIGFQCQ
jgi:hypothetical protein